MRVFVLFKHKLYSAYLLAMLPFTKGNSGEITVTLTELSTLEEPFYYLFVFTHIETKTTLKKILSTEDDSSNYKYRYNKWILESVDDFFGDMPIGSYLYEVYEQLSSTDETTDGKTLVENGKAQLFETEFEYQTYSTETTYKSYNG